MEDDDLDDLLCLDVANGSNLSGLFPENEERKRRHRTPFKNQPIDQPVSSEDENEELYWRRATEWSQLCFFMEKFVVGDVQASPTYHGSLSIESAPIVKYLVTLNRMGFLTTVSQPGVR